MSKPHSLPTPEQIAQTAQQLATLTPDELSAVTVRMQQAGQNLATITPDEVAELIDQMLPQLQVAPVQQSDLPGGPDDWADLEEFLDDTLPLSYKGSRYRLQAADIDTGLECQMLLGVGARMRAGGTPTSRQRNRLEDAEETELFIRLLGGQQWTVEPIEASCSTCGSPPGQPCHEVLPGLPAAAQLEADELEEPHTGRGVPNPHYDPDRDVWRQLHTEGRSWAFVQHVGTTAIFWAAFGTVAALEYWKSGGRPKANPEPAAPVAKVPADRKPRKASTAATTTPRPASGSSSPRKRPAKKATPGPRS